MAKARTRNPSRGKIISRAARIRRKWPSGTHLRRRRIADRRQRRLAALIGLDVEATPESPRQEIAIGKIAGASIATSAARLQVFAASRFPRGPHRATAATG